jgi:hypothetical protein
MRKGELYYSIKKELLRTMGSWASPLTKGEENGKRSWVNRYLTE